MKKSIVALSLTGLLLLTACATKPLPAPPSLPSPSPQAGKTTPAPSVSPSVPTAVAEWEKVIELAKKEGTVNFYAVNIPLAVKPQLSKAFKEKYGITLEIVGPLNPPELPPKLAMERQSKAYVADVVETGGSSPVLVLKPQGFLAEPIRVPETQNLETWVGNPFITDPEGYIFNYYNFTPGPLINTKVVGPEREPKSYLDLLDPWWKGKIIWDDPSVFGPGSLAFTVVWRTLGEDYLRQLAKQDVKVSRVRVEQHDQLLRGEYAILLGPATPFILRLLEAGAPVKVLRTKEGTASSGWGVMLIKNAPHPNAAHLFINWFISKEGQTIFSTVAKIPSYRKDVPQEHIHPYFRITGDSKEIPLTKDFIDDWGKGVVLAADIFRTGR